MEIALTDFEKRMEAKKAREAQEEEKIKLHPPPPPEDADMAYDHILALLEDEVRTLKAKGVVEETQVRYTHNVQVGIGYITLNDNKVAKSVKVPSGNVILDLDASGEVVGVELKYTKYI